MHHQSTIIIGAKAEANRLVSEIAQSVIGSENFESHPDFYSIKETEKNSIGIAAVNSIREIAQLKSYNGIGKMIVIYDAQLLTTEAQNALLKLIEEPAESTQIVLIADRVDNFLPTILSRCSIENIGGVNLFEVTELESFSIEDFLKLGIIEKFAFIEKLHGMKNPQEKLFSTKFFLEEIHKYALQKLTNGEFSSEKTKNILKLVDQTFVYIDSNTNYRLALENLIANIEI